VNTPARQYMGPAPVLGFRINPARMVDSATITVVDTPPTLTDPGLQRSLRWVVAVAVCPYCGGEHEHTMSQTSLWGWFTTPCTHRTRGYYLSNDPPAHGLT
jgi:hypothetical protein